ncbi:MAG: nucleotidyltransferase domain-containing protein [Candidatus Brocadiae bacterium]|nr:nucleotidyltransferase domain-containing protein [Candidatus Brocadiia bacterium]
MSGPATSLQAPEVTPELLAEVTRRIVTCFGPEKVVLFGSHAWGTPQPDSDVDLLVVMESDARPAHRSAAVDRACRPRFLPLDVLVKTPTELQERLRLQDPFIRRIVEQGRVLYER